MARRVPCLHPRRHELPAESRCHGGAFLLLAARGLKDGASQGDKGGEAVILPSSADLLSYCQTVASVPFLTCEPGRGITARGVALSASVSSAT